MCHPYTNGNQMDIQVSIIKKLDSICVTYPNGSQMDIQTTIIKTLDGIYQYGIWQSKSEWQSINSYGMGSTILFIILASFLMQHMGQSEAHWAQPMGQSKAHWTICPSWEVQVLLALQHR